jgi:glycosyltransferase involved in cell wall biosynthesis
VNSNVPERVKSPRSLSVVVETHTPSEYRGTEDWEALARTLDALENQSLRQEIEVIVVLDSEGQETVGRLTEAHPNVTCLSTASQTYYEMKNAGIATAHGDVIALLDGDCTPCDTWAESLLAAIENGKGVVAGRTRYRSRSLWARSWDVFDFGHVEGGSHQQANGFVFNNVAFTENLRPRLTVPPGLRRSGACELLAARLKASGVPIVYEPAARVEHGNDYQRGGWLQKRLRNGFDSVNLLQYDSARNLRHWRLAALGPAAALAVAAGRVAWDVKRIVGNRRDLEITIPLIPYFWALAFFVRASEALSGCAAYFARPWFAKRFG